MGYLLSDHRGGTNHDGSKGTLHEWETISCPHCLAISAIVVRGRSKEVEYHNYCARCKKPVCQSCAKVMEKLGNCPGPFIARVEAEMKAGHALENFQYQYHSCTRA